MLPTLATSKWWKEERHGVFLDYNQNAKDRTTCSAYSVRPLPDARVSAPLDWHEVPDCDPADFTVLTMPQRFAEIGDPHAGMDAAAGSLEGLLGPRRAGRSGGTGRRSMAAALPQDGRRSAAGRALAREGCCQRHCRKGRQEAADEDAAHRHRQLAGQDSGTGRSRAVEGEASGRRRRMLAVDDVLVDSMRGRSSTWTRIRVNLRNVPEELRPPQDTPDPDDDPTREWREPIARRDEGRRSKLAARLRKICRQLLRRHHLELRERAVGRTLVRAPPAKLRRVPEACAPACDRTPPRPPARDAAAPTTDPSPDSSGSDRQAGAVRRALRRPPSACPGMVFERVLAIRREELHELPPLAFVKLAHTPTCWRCPARQRGRAAASRPRPLAVLVPAKAGDDAIAVALVLHLQHHALVRLRRCHDSSFAITPSRPAPSKRRNQSAARVRSRVAGVRCSGGAAREHRLQSSRAARRTARCEDRDRRRTAGRRTPPTPASAATASFTRDAAGWRRSCSASKSSAPSRAMTISPSSTQRSGSWPKQGSTSSGK